jgi:uncharacterized protein YndB with AHSA1/START domain
MIVRDPGVVEITRVFDFPRESVFSMWTDPRKAAKWFGTPEGHVTVVREWDPRPGGAIKIEDHSPDGTIFAMAGSFVKVVSPELIIFRSAAPCSGVGSSPWEALNTVTFEELGPKRTRMTVAVDVVAAAPEEIEALRQGFKLGWAQSLEKLQRALS